MATVDTGRGTRTRRVTTTGALLAALLAAGLAAGCTASNAPGDDGRGSPRTTRPGGTEETGGDGHPPVLAVKIDNAPAARPQTGLESADVVYVEQVEGGLSRLMAVYASRLPESVGPVRSAREADLELLRQFDRPVLAFSGAQGRLLPLIDRAPLEPLTPGTSDTGADVYVRGPHRPAPHNLYLQPRRFMDDPPGRASLTTGFRDGPPPAGGEPENTRTVRYPAARFTFTWSDARNRWLVSMDGTPTVTARGEPVAPSTVVVQYVTVRPSGYHDSRGSNTPYTETVGSGAATVLRDGRAHEVRWSRPDASDGTAFTTEDGTAVNFAQGQVWVVYAEAA
ncbi:DUF3048 domain-containing protein [Streptomyces sp. NEAU-W12]|uniref:DUF3048 domain-containing protein n=1 Tax=Streptomyces sp. NEAU-W12 TaxID=2994668 RepID=UPI00224B363C|nr:DUF3048 domain-containing protein [Streptomyces sp. NEAU-W12]MCX2926207.1 DUF3048 domain-containing protein [Streptomyces sp. NEAU-W12]